MSTESGYPEEQPQGPAPGDDPREKDSPPPERTDAPDAGSERAPDNEDGTATGNPHSAGER